MYQEYEDFDSALRALPNDTEAEKRNKNIRKFCSLSTTNHGTIPDEQNLQLHRHKNLIAAYEKMVMRENSANVAMESSEQKINRKLNLMDGIEQVKHLS